MIPFLIAALLFAAPAPEPVTSDDIYLELVGSFSQPLYVTAPEGDHRLFVVEKGGKVKVVIDNQVVGTYLDVGPLLTSPLGGEQGLLGMAFHPDFASNGKVYISFTNTAGDVVISELLADPNANTVSISGRRTILIVSQPFSNHNGGMILFGPDGYLYVGSGDGGSGGDPDGNGQNKNTVLGKILRIDVDGDDFPADSTRNYSIPPDNPFVGVAGADEIWVYGLRNPWRFWIDPPTGRLYIGDVGQNSWEEVTVLEPGSEGANLGWDILEGTHCYPPGTSCSSAGTVLPQIEYSHGSGASVTGGVVYRGQRIQDLQGTYFYADFLQDFVRSFRYDGTVTQHLDWSGRFGTGRIASFGTDGFGEMYLVSLSGPLWRVRGPVDNDEMFFYRDDGLFRFYNVRPDGTLPGPMLQGDNYTTGWDAITAIDLDGDGQDEMFFYRDDGVFRFYHVLSNGSLPKPLLEGEGYTSGWDAITAIDLDGDGQDEMFFYRDDGVYRYYNIGADGMIGKPILAEGGYTTGWDAITAIDLDGDGQDEMFFYRNDGVFRFYDVRSDGKLPKPLLEGEGYTTGWDAITAIDLDGDGQDEMFFYRNDGVFRFYNVRTDGSLPAPILQGDNYTTGWDAITAINLD